MVQASTCLKDKHWDSGLKITKDHKCPSIEDAEATKVVVPYNIWMLIMRLTREVDTEWLGYLQAEQTESGDWHINELEIPEQEVAAATVTPTKTIHAPGVIHSHVNMGATFSGTDDKFLNENHDFSIVVNKKAQVSVVQRIKLPCGALTIIESSLEVNYPEPEEAEGFVEAAKKKFTEKTYAVVNTRKNKTHKPDPNQEGYYDEYGQWYYPWGWARGY